MIVRDLLLSLGAPALAVPAASVLGAWRRRAGVERDAETHAAASFALVLAWLQAGGMVLGTLGALRAPLALAWIVAGVLAAAAAARRVSLPALRPAHALLLLPIAGYLLLATVPPWDRDEMVYHLALPRQFALAGGYVQPDDNVFASLPLGWESALSLVYALGARGEPLFNPRLLTAWTAAAGALATIGLARSLGARTAWLAGAALLAVPTFVEFGSSGYVEPYQVLLVTLSLTCVAREFGAEPGSGRAHRQRRARRRAGLALARRGAGRDRRLGEVPGPRGRHVPRPGAADPAARGGRPSRGALPRRGPRRRPARSTCATSIQRHNPFFPLAFDVFGGRGWDTVRSEAYWETLRLYGDSDGPLDALALPLRLFFSQGSGPRVRGIHRPRRRPRRRGHGRPLASPRPAPRRPRRPGGRRALRGRILPLLGRDGAPGPLLPPRRCPPLLALLAAAIDLAGARANALGAVAVAASLAWGAALYAAVWTRQLTSAWLTGAVDREALLGRLLPESYPVLRELSGLVPPAGRVWLVWTRGYTYYLDRAYRLDSVFEGWRFEALLDQAPDPAALGASLRADGITHVLVNRRYFLQGESADTEPGRTARLRGRFDAVLAAGTLVEEKRWKAMILFRVGP